MVALTIGMATYNDFDGVYFTLQALRLYQDLADTELLVVDNYGCEHTERFVTNWAKARYLLASDAVGTAAPRERVFVEAKGDAVLCCDSHVLFAPGVIARLKTYYQEHPGTKDLLQGPIVYDDLGTISTHFEPVWRAQMWGIWATDPRGVDPEAEPFDIWGQGLGVFSCRKAAWPSFNPAFRGFGGEEGYIHEKVRQAGGRTLCLPWLRWGHRFGRPAGVPYKVRVEDKLWNYLIGHMELGLDPAPVLEHFADHLPEERLAAVVEEVLSDQPITKPESTKRSKKGKKARKKGKSKKREESSNVGIAEVTTLEANTPERPSDETNEYLPLISCICSTYNRPPSHQHLVEEAIESFLRQSYPNKELIILNDCPGQELVCDAPGVRVVNVAERFPSLGEKHNAAIALARGDLIAIWDDDDISLPWRLSLSAERLGDADYFNPKRFWMMARDELRPDPKTNVGHNLSLYRRTAFEAVGGYPPIGSGVDAALDQAFHRQVKCVGSEAASQGALAYDELYYIYRWGVSPAHLSASGKNSMEKYERVGARLVQPGRFQLLPHWRKDYVAETRRLIENICSASSDNNAPPPSESAALGDSASYPAKIAAGGANRATLDKLRESGALMVAEIGVYHGGTSEAIARHLSGRGELHLFDFSDRVDRVATRLHALGFENVIAHGNSYRTLDSYNWSLMRLLEKHPEPIFDYVFIDGAHTWAHDALAFLLVDRLLRPGGYVDLDDYHWSFAISPSLSPQVFPQTAEHYTQEQIQERQVALVINLLVRRDPRYTEIVKNKIFQKISDSCSSATPARDAATSL